MMTEIKKKKKLVNSFLINFDTECLPTVLFTLYDVCSVHWGMCSTSGEFRTSRGYHDEYIGGCSVYQGCSVHQGDTMRIS